MDIVIAKYGEDVTWSLSLKTKHNIFVYDKSDCPAPGHIPLPNISREDFAYLFHILGGRLADHTCFLQGNPFDHCNNLMEFLDRDPPDTIWWLNNHTTHWMETGPQGDCHRLPVEEFLKILFRNPPAIWHFNPSAQFIVPRQFIEHRSKTFFQVCLSLCSYPEGGWILERIWPLIFDPQVEAKY